MAQCQKSTAQSLMDSEIIAVNKGVKEAAWLEKVIKDLGERGSDPYIPTLYCDNLGGINLIKDIKFYNKQSTSKYVTSLFRTT
jgi:methylaspartate ammonia-lyase